MGLTVAVTGPTGTIGHGLMALLEQDARVERVVGVARRPFDPARAGWAKMDYRRADVRDRDALIEAFSGADVVVHLAFMITGAAGRDTLRAINVDGTRNAFEAAAAAGAGRFVYTSSVAAYGFFADNPLGMTERQPVRPAAHLFYGQEKAEVELALERAARRRPELELYVLRPSVVLGPHSLGAKTLLPGPLRPLGAALGAVALRLPVALPVPVAPLALQLVHERDVGRALALCIHGAGPPGAYNIAADEILTLADVARELGLAVVALPRAPVQLAARMLAALPFAPPAVGWGEALGHPAIMDTGKARRELGWAPRHSALETLRDSIP